MVLGVLCMTACRGGGASTSDGPLAAGDGPAAVPADGAAGGGGAAGGSGGSAGVGGTGGGAGPDAAASSPGTTTLRLRLPAGLSYCDMGVTCGSLSHISIRRIGGESVNIDDRFFDCPVQCRTCMRPACPGVACLPTADPFTGQQLTWDGTVYERGACGPARMQCQQDRSFVPAGRYLAVMCATPGVVQRPDGGMPTCMRTGETECVEVPFDLPSGMVVEGSLTGTSPRDR